MYNRLQRKTDFNVILHLTICSVHVLDSATRYVLDFYLSTKTTNESVFCKFNVLTKIEEKTSTVKNCVFEFFNFFTKKTSHFTTSSHSRSWESLRLLTTIILIQISFIAQFQCTLFTKQIIQLRINGIYNYGRRQSIQIYFPCSHWIPTNSLLYFSTIQCLDGPFILGMTVWNSAILRAAFLN